MRRNHLVLCLYWELNLRPQCAQPNKTSFRKFNYQIKLLLANKQTDDIEGATNNTPILNSSFMAKLIAGFIKRRATMQKRFVQ